MGIHTQEEINDMAYSLLRLSKDNERMSMALRWYQQEVKALKKYREQTNNFELGARTLFVDDGEMAARALEGTE